eukprot:CAMPEP_0168520824 /NCGR_PEP_ID=MMETSP0405-20121227/8275_1 /TAXON_ID=498012 /ORGANISM="Trichosphaerium sp, Strain Am-I-7 wt" /LENGTH=274 /DNA_ID=CAMNT_0008541895 /DNA_START=35 /DNA_END=856 /DNA_ORIENTATION=-
MTEGTPSDIERFWLVNPNDLIVKKDIGKGAYGVVQLADYLGLNVAVKTIAPSNSSNNADLVKYTRREIAIMKSARHPNIVCFIGIVTAGRQTGLGTQIVLEYLPGGDLRQVLKGPKEISYHRRMIWAQDIACAMAYLHSRGIVYRDLKCKNLLLDENNRVKLCDFGFARVVSTKERPNTMCGTDDFMAPEVILGLDYNERADIFSYGLVMLELITRAKIGVSLKRTVQNSFALEEKEAQKLVPRMCPPHFSKLAMLCCKYDPKDRPPFKKIIMA